MKYHLLPLIIAASLMALHDASAQPFPIAVGNDSTFSGGAVFGGANGLVTIIGDNTGPNAITAQIIGTGGTLVGPRISIGATGIFPGAMPVFDGTNYLLIWVGLDGTLRGQRMSTAGSLIGSSFPIATGINTTRTAPYGIAMGDTTSLVVYLKNDNYVWGQQVGRYGNLIGAPLQITGNFARDHSIAFDGTNFLVVWVETIPDTDKDIFGQFVSKSGTLVGGNFVIDNGPNYSDNPTSLACDGSRYFLAFHEQKPGGDRWTMTGRFISKTGTIGETVVICDTTKMPGFASAGFDGTNYLVTWSQRIDSTLMGQFYSTAGATIGSPFVIFGPVGNRLPMGGVGYGGGLYLAIGTWVDANFTDGDVYGRFISPLTGVEDETATPLGVELFQNYPNPFNPATQIGFRMKEGGWVKVAVMDLLGREVAMLVNEEKGPGSYTVNWDASGMPTGIYIYRLQTGKNVETRKMLLTK
jgi:hypothetical protein